MLSTTYVTNKCRSTLNMMQKEMNQLLKINQSNINYICKRQRQMKDTQERFEAELEEKYQTALEQLMTQKLAASKAH